MFSIYGNEANKCLPLQPDRVSYHQLPANTCHLQQDEL